MTTATPSELRSFADWLRATDDHWEHHLRLLDEVDRADAAASDRRADLAAKLERWRYQHLNEHAEQLAEQDEAFVDALDRTANGLAGRAPRPPRATRHAVRDAAFDRGTMAEALDALDRNLPLDDLGRWAERVTAENFSVADGTGTARRRMLLYAPLYVSSDCVNFCTYCGFRYPLGIPRKQLTAEEAGDEARVLCDRGFRHILVVGGDFPSRTTPAYYCEILQTLVRQGVVPAVEIAALNTDAYAELVRAGTHGVTLYQETYDERLYHTYHERGPKASYHWRLEAHERAAEAGMARLGFGILLGLADPRADLRAMMRHGAYLAERFPDRTLAFSLPRIHEAPESFQVPFPTTDDDLVRLYCVLRIAFPRAELVLSTREQPALRDRLARICITQISAGSSTSPGGYRATDEPAGEQFPVADHRSPAEMAEWLKDAGFHVAWSIGGEDFACTTARRGRRDVESVAPTAAEGRRTAVSG